ncbi:hypothetical protein [Paenibacillus ottowii]|uniref:Uncharacterized protein n=1 Tax=Paenibacillus ottowii TaxID=2315729 RepID=A0ABY3BDC2_9BACL|nr:hypothetical protein [Paenibacillus ottowii]TQS01401.1 hypothetical protein FKV70_03450 [Paenibacillus ottowii]TQS01456.1 hypothetical protein FKV70_03740 [Paenibacillus ottowii]
MKMHEELKARAADMHKRLGGTIFAFPIEEENPLSKYAVAVFNGKDYSVYPNAMTIEEAAAGILEVLNGFKEEGWDHDYERNVRFALYQSQVDAPSVTMRRLKKGKGNYTIPAYESDIDVMDNPDDPEGKLFSARGLIKFSYLTMIDEKNPVAISFMNEYYKLLASFRYGKTAAAIKQEVRRMGRDEAIRWIEHTYERYIKDSRTITDILNAVGKGQR